MTAERLHQNLSNMNTQEISKNQIGSRGLKLTVMTLDIDPGSKPVTQVFYKDELTLGRLPSNDVVLGRPEISGIHARLRIEKGESGDPDRLFITDLGSSNGTSVEKSQLRPRIEIAMMPNERIFIGNYVIKPSILTSASEAPVSEEKEKTSPGQNEMGDSSPTTALKRNHISDVGKEFQSGVSKDSIFSDDSSSSNTTRSSWDMNPASSIIFSEGLDTAAGSKEPVQDQPEDSDSNSMKALTQDSYTTTSSMPEINEAFHDRMKTMEFKAPFGTPLTKEEEDLRGAKEVPEVSSSTIIPPIHEPAAKDTFSVQEHSTQQSSSNGNGFHSSFESNESISENSKTVDVSNIASSPVTSSGSHTIRVKVDGADVRSMNFVARAFTNLKGKVAHKDRPLAGVLVDAGSLGTSVTDSDGSFTFSNVLEGTDYSIKLSKDKFQFSPFELTGSVSVSNEIISAHATQLFTISGIITHQGHPLAGVEVDGGEIGKVLIKDDGSYLFENVPEGKEYNLTLRKEGYVFKN